MWILKENNGFKIVFKYCTRQHNFTLKYKIKPSALTNTGTEYFKAQANQTGFQKFCMANICFNNDYVVDFFNHDNIVCRYVGFNNVIIINVLDDFEIYYVNL